MCTLYMIHRQVNVVGVSEFTLVPSNYIYMYRVIINSSVSLIEESATSESAASVVDTLRKSQPKKKVSSAKTRRATEQGMS